MDTKTTITASLVGLGLIANAALAVLPKDEEPTYTKEGEKVAVERIVCEPFTYVASKEEIVDYVTKIQALIDQRTALGIPLDNEDIERLERYKTRFVEDAGEVEKINK